MTWSTRGLYNFSSLREMFRDKMGVNEREREREAGVYYFNHWLIKIK